MGAIWGNKIKYTIFGESHGHAVGIVIDGLSSGIRLDLDMIQAEMSRRRPGTSNLTTTRKETDQFEILSGIFNGFTTGAPLFVMIRNTNQQSGDYEQQKDYIRPGHADYTAYIKSNGFNDYRGGGHFSGRLTAPIVFAGAIAKQLLTPLGINITSHIYSIGTEKDLTFMEMEVNETIINNLAASDFPTINSSKAKSMRKIIEDARLEGDSVGGVVECAVINLSPGLGDPFFNSLESSISHLVFSIPGVKGIEFGDGFDIAEKKGSEANDPFYVSGKSIKTAANHNGGILGGLSTGMPLIFRAAFKPTPSIALEQNTVNIKTMENTTVNIKGRHDPCIVPRVVPVIEAAAAMAILEHLK